MNKFGVGPKILSFTIISSILTLVIFAFQFPNITILTENRLFFFTIGTVHLLLGVFLYVFTFLQLNKDKKNNVLCKSGLYRHVRHPLYSIWILIITPGIVLLIGLFPLFFTQIWALLYFYLFIGTEEKQLEHQFGDEYFEYEKCTGRLLPKIFKEFK